MKKRKKNVSSVIPNGRTLQTRDEYFEGSSNYRKPGYENKGLYRSAVIVDSNRNDELALIILTTKGESIPGRTKSKFRPFIETLDDEGNPIKFGKKFKENNPKKDLSLKAVGKIKKLTFKEAGNAEENRRKVRFLKNRK